ncbi:hypothetical protein [Bacillus sonorensis]|uniref:hypothetical protein n=1 Tax=Bacillus sonorensis TaxID=119858 RepID=UPI002DB84B1A|nr:hypothetical protein [Bacillus sonorensis]MEC0341871.1 hypothetical protein [Bacillus sonorensis]MEC0457443.1 hypothetical protein [Bacillus sonorensis]MEC0530762.1 hypothetical protein [Bacillus sonorensis]
MFIGKVVSITGELLAVGISLGIVKQSILKSVIYDYQRHTRRFPHTLKQYFLEYQEQGDSYQLIYDSRIGQDETFVLPLRDDILELDTPFREERFAWLDGNVQKELLG